eukprot:CAMPEP_0198728910 /NCGR_PEP_ID=MMETSP1475-20131203/11926_1 /TAXON_ID= ORGANISM="Unidentified sp., Strain CCMP1999" /NCGR_SAMPLE_ID=MMETSP1475 /ASSEMBLY_ACC=CAM_ASM_001111 /LENGTH=184 /DNA_ID=CAMNT_0044491387 /DNA_START=68 /DNA_END=621 /DNA_ORIENTATION=+
MAWRGQIGRVMNWLRSREEVGRDKLGNIYYKVYAGHNTEKRTVEYKSTDPSNITDMPKEWWSWLHHSRDDPPTLKEIALSERQAGELKKRVERLEEADAKQRVRQFASGNRSASGRESNADAIHRIASELNVPKAGKEASRPATGSINAPIRRGTEEEDSGVHKHEDPQGKGGLISAGCMAAGR